MIREFLYVDIQRTRSLLAQLDGGVVEQHVRRTVWDDSHELGAKVLGIGGSGSWATQESSEESRSLTDLTFVVFEEAAAAIGLITDASLSTDPEDWSSGLVHSQFKEGEIVRVTGDVLVTDPSYVESRFRSVDSLMSAVMEMQVATALQAADGELGNQLAPLETQLLSANPAQRKNLEKRIGQLKDNVAAQVRQEVEAQMGGRVVLDQLKMLFDLVSSFMGDGLGVRMLPCGVEHSELGLAGSLLGRDEYIQRERAELFSRYGSTLRGWTIVMQIAHIPSEEDTKSARSMDLSRLGGLVSGQAINRAAFERMVTTLLDGIESMGVTEGPRWPTISVVPLAIYRTVPGSSAGTTDAAVP